MAEVGPRRRWVRILSLSMLKQLLPIFSGRRFSPRLQSLLCVKTSIDSRSENKIFEVQRLTIESSIILLDASSMKKSLR
jgi:hypothetical protein